MKSNDNLTLQLYSIPSFHGENEAEILIIAILGENEFFAILGGEEIFRHFRGKEILVKDWVTFVGGKYYLFST